ncbi:MAG: pilin, partial [bacterium]
MNFRIAKNLKYLAGSIALFILGALPIRAADTVEKIVGPDLQTQIPGFQGFSTVTFQQYGDRVVASIPFLAEYITALFKWAVGAGALIAAFFITLGGFQWVISGGDSTKVKAAKNRITQALTGLIILICSFVFLNTINPELVSMKNMEIEIVPQVKFIENEPVIDDPAGLVKENINIATCPGLVELPASMFRFSDNAHHALRAEAAVALIAAAVLWQLDNQGYGPTFYIQLYFSTKAEHLFLYDLYKADSSKPKAADP